MLLEKNAKFRQRLNEALPIDDGLLKDASLIGIGGEGKIQHADSRVMVGDEDLDEVIGEVEKLKNYVNKLELQIYEMNEKVSELIENVSLIIINVLRWVDEVTLISQFVWVPSSPRTEPATGTGKQETESRQREHEPTGQDGHGEHERQHRHEQTVSRIIDSQQRMEGGIG